MGEAIAPTEPLPFHYTPEDWIVVNTPDDQYIRLSWEHIKDVIAKGDLAKLTRTPSQLKKYTEWSVATRKEYGNVTNYLLKKRLFWEPIPSASNDVFAFATANQTPFTDPADYLLLRNDWPYGHEPGMFHLVLWTKHRLPIDAEQDGVLTPAGRKMIDDFVRVEVEEKLGVVGQDKVIWWKNYGTTSSIRTVDHAHVLVRDLPKDKVDALLSRVK